MYVWKYVYVCMYQTILLRLRTLTRHIQTRSSSKDAVGILSSLMCTSDQHHLTLRLVCSTDEFPLHYKIYLNETFLQECVHGMWSTFTLCSKTPTGEDMWKSYSFSLNLCGFYGANEVVVEGNVFLVFSMPSAVQFIWLHMPWCFLRHGNRYLMASSVSYIVCYSPHTIWLLASWFLLTTEERKYWWRPCKTLTYGFNKMQLQVILLPFVNSRIWLCRYLFSISHLITQTVSP